MAYKNLPNLRFSGFSEEWKEEPLENIIEFLKGNDSGNYKLPILTISAGKGWMLQSDRFGNVLAGNELKNYTLLKKGQLSYNHGNSKLAKYGAVFSLKDYNEALVPKVYHSFKILNGDSDFIERLFESKKTDRQLRKMITSGARMDGLLNINKQSFGSILINFPTLIEQQKIGDFFAKQDKLIELQTQKVDQLKKLKRGYLQKMFPQEGETVPRLRFSGFSGEWKEESIEEIAPLETGYSFKSDKFISDGLPIIRISNILNNGNIGGDFKYYKESESLQKFVVNNGSILIAMSGATVGKISLLKKNGFYLNQRVGYFKTNVHYDNSFVYCLLKSNNYYKNMNSIKVAGAQPNISKSEINGFNFLLPNHEEQQKIGDFFAKLDKLIEEQSNKLNQLKQQKKAYLQKMFI
ncbi:restriction endonuclease subunit S [Apilactobacillus kunkeei]|uniref:restriction endonuclease subunit S n=1 Tax=Apilactobacillus kunkeei TaxID=148814 RepID=UPI0013645A01|nr:restriction endonuclease subunit S [Apilactobacillus kunkeei]